LGFGLGYALDRLRPAHEGMRGGRLLLGWILAGAGVALAASAIALFRRASTSPVPNQPTTALVAQGPYRFTRNPMYVGLAALEAGNSANTVGNYLRDIARLIAHASTKGAGHPDAITAAQLREFVYDLKDLGLAPATIRRQISAIRTYYRFLVGEGHATRDPSERLESPKQWRTLPTVLTVPEVGRLLAAPNTDEPLAMRDRALLEFAYATGARVSEVVGVKPQDLLYED